MKHNFCYNMLIDLFRFTTYYYKGKDMSVSEMTDAAKHMLEIARHDVRAFLPSVDATMQTDLILKLRVYDRAIRPNFIPWMLSTWSACYSETARVACAENLTCEISENHPKMLADFVAQHPVGTREWAKEHDAAMDDVLPSIGLLTSACALRNKYFGLPGLLVMATLENTSRDFLDEWMVPVANTLGLEERVYLDKHGEADVKHADEFINAVAAEAVALKVSPKELQGMPYIGYTVKFLEAIFSASWGFLN